MYIKAICKLLRYTLAFVLWSGATATLSAAYCGEESPSEALACGEESLSEAFACGEESPSEGVTCGEVGRSEPLSFDSVFADSTLRIDYSMSGGGGLPVGIAMRKASRLPGWAGRRVNMDEPPYLADGIFTLTDAATGDTIYSISFSTLFHEWLDTDEALSTPRAMDHVILSPMPHNRAIATVELRDSHRRVMASTSHPVDPADILIRPISHPFPLSDSIVDLHISGPADRCIDIAIIGEGYTREEADTFISQARRATDALFRHEPFASMANRFNVRAVVIPSPESGVSVPRLGQWVDTPFASHFSTFYSNRYLTSPAPTAIHDALVGIPYEHIIVLANTSEYGGGGIFNSYTLTAGGAELMEPVVVHEFGHSFGGLGDEYFYEAEQNDTFYPAGIEPWSPNITTLVDFPSKWEHLIPDGTPIPTPAADADKYPIGLYEGGGYSSHGVWRPADRCRMRDNAWPGFCPACEEALRTLILYYTEESTPTIPE